MRNIKELGLLKKYACLFFCLVLFFALMSPSYSYGSEVNFTRLSGINRYQTACSIALEGWATSEYAILASGENFPDALTATPLAYCHNAPILLTEKNSLNTHTAETLESLKVTKVIIIGGTSAVSQSIQDKLISLGYVTIRIAGKDRYETSVKIAEELKKVIDIKEISFVPGDQYAYALAISSIAAKRQMAIVLLPKDNIPDSVQDFLRKTVVNKTYLIGYGSNLTSDVDNLMSNPEKINGKDQYDTCLKVINKFRENYYVRNTIIATGTNFADALTGTAFAAKICAPILLTDKTIDTNLQGWIQDKRQNIEVFYTLGGEGVLPYTLISGYLGAVEDTNDRATKVENNIISFLYPDNWVIHTVPEHDTYIFRNNNSLKNIIAIRYSTLQNPESIEQYADSLNWLSSFQNANKEYFMINGVNALSWDFLKGDTTQREIRIIKDNKLCSITFTWESLNTVNELDDLEVVLNSLIFN